MQWAGPFSGQVRHIGFSTGWGSVGEFKIWRKEEADENHNEAFTLGVPHNVVAGSERATASMIGEDRGYTHIQKHLETAFLSEELEDVILGITKEKNPSAYIPVF